MARPTRPEERTNEYFLDGEGISREVIQADICRYLGNDALVRQGTHQGRHGYIITAYRNLTSNMISDLKTDSARWEHDVSRRTEQGYSRGNYKNPGLSPSQSPNNVPGNYVQSSIHDGRQQAGPSQGYNSGPPPQSHYGSVPSNQGYSMPPYQQQNLGYAQNTGAYPPQSQSPYNPPNQSQPPSAPDMHPSYTHHGGPGYPQYAEGRPRFTGQGDEFDEYREVSSGVPYATTAGMPYPSTTAPDHYREVASGIPYATTAGMPYPTTTAPDMRMEGYQPDPYQVGSQRPRDSGRRGR